MTHSEGDAGTARGAADWRRTGDRCGPAQGEPVIWIEGEPDRGRSAASDLGPSGAGEAVSLRGVSVRFPRRLQPVLQGVSLDVAPGEQVAVLGASGSGKSTLLGVVTGVVPHSVNATFEGEVTLAGDLATGTPVVQRSRHVGMVAQDPASAVCLPVVEQELALVLENHAVDPEHIGARIARALHSVGAGPLQTRASHTLSGGEAQRVALAAALVARADVLLLDEPTSMLDPAGVRSLGGALDGALRGHRPAVLLVEHRLDEWDRATGFAGRPARAVALSQDGRVVADGPFTTVLHEHAFALHAAGCWLPLNAELLAVTGASGGLDNCANRRWLRGAATRTRTRPATAHPVLTARALTVGRPTTPAGSRRRQVKDRDPHLRGVVGSVDLTVGAGEIVALLGANGVGKTTLMLTLARLLEPLAGRVDGPRAGLVFQNAEHQFLGQTVRAEVGQGLPADIAEAVVARQLHRHRLEHLADQNPFRLSGGEKRRLSLAAMLAHDRPVLLADEPTLGLDRRDALATMRTLRDFASAGAAVVFASHDLRLVAAYASGVIVLGKGRVLAQGPTVDVLADPKARAQAGLTLPPLVEWLLENVPLAAVPTVLRALDGTVEGGPPPHTGAAR